MKYKYSDIKNSFHSQEPWINVFLLKHLTIPLVYLMVKFTNITPNIISIISLILGILSAFFYFNGDLFAGGLLYFISYIFDATDGKVARIKGNGSAYGAWFDIAIDRLNLVIISSAISYTLFIAHDNLLFMVLNSLFLGMAFIGWESRYNIDIYKLKFPIKLKEGVVISSYEKWCLKKGVIKEPISLPEMFLFYLIVIPHLNNELGVISIIVMTLFLFLRICKQQIFWFNVANR